jgi:hypothetical protein
MAHHPGTTRAHYGCPHLRMIHCRIKVSITMPTTIYQVHTLKLLTLSLTNAVAAVAGLTCVGWIYQHQGNTRTHTFVSQELAQLVERPTVGTSAFCLASWLLVRAFSNACQLFDSNTPAIGFGLFDESVTNGVIDVGLEPSFPARQPLLKLPHPSASTSCAFRSFVLKLRSLFGALVSEICQLLSTELFSLGSVCNIRAAKIYSQTFSHFFQLRRCGLDLNIDVVGAIFALGKRGRSWFRFRKQVPLVVANRHRDLFASIQQDQPNNPFFGIEAKDLGIIINTCGCKTLNRSALHLGCLTVGTDTGNGTNRQIGRKAKECAAVIVNKRLHRCLIRQLLRRAGVNPSAGIRKCFECCVNLQGLFSRWVKLARYRQYLLHSCIIIHPGGKMQPDDMAAPPPQPREYRASGARAVL